MKKVFKSKKALLITVVIVLTVIKVGNLFFEHLISSDQAVVRTIERRNEKKMK